MHIASAHDEIREIIVRSADRHGIPRRAALAFAWIESRFDPDAEGDLEWHEKRDGRLYRTHVLRAARFAQNPARSDAKCWHSYGLFQLLACYHCEGHEHPSALLDPELNADRGCRMIARLLRRANGDIRSARLAYIGCGYEGELCSDKTVSAAVDALTAALLRFRDQKEAPHA